MTGSSATHLLLSFPKGESHFVRLLSMIAAFLATTAESYIGASLQDKYEWMTNEVVNAINTAIGVSVAMIGYALIGGA